MDLRERSYLYISDLSVNFGAKDREANQTAGRRRAKGYNTRETFVLNVVLKGSEREEALFFEKFYFLGG